MQIPILVSVFLLLFAFTFSGKIITNLLIYRSCYITLKNNESICALLGFKFDNETIALEKLVQPHAAVIDTTKSMLETIVPACLCFFIGSWSDKYGRRPVMLTSLGGYSIGYLILTIVSFIKSASPWFILLSSIPICLTGGFPAFYTAVICSITDLSVENRGFRLGILEAVVSLSFLLGDLACPFIFNACGYFLSFAITTVSIFLSFSIILLIVPETIQNPQTEINFYNLIKFSRVRETVQTTIKRREGHDRALLFLVIAIMVTFLLATTADGGIFYLYIRNKLHWTLETYTIYAVLRNIARIVGTIVGCYFLHRLLNIQEVYLILLGNISTTSSSIVQGLATQSWHMYTAGGLKAFSGNILPMARSLVSKIIASEETSQVFSFIIITQTFVDFIGPPIYLYIYDKTLNNYYYSGVFNFLTAAIFVFSIILIIPIIRLLKRRNNAVPYEIINDDSVIDNEN